MEKTVHHVVLRDTKGKSWLHFKNPVQVVAAMRREDVTPLLRGIEETVEKERLFAAGFVAYEAAPAFDPALAVREGGSFPFLWFGLFQSIRRSNSLPDVPYTPAAELEWTPSLTQPEYRRAFRKIKDYIRSGDTYQVNFTYRLRAAFALDPWSYFAGLARSQNPPYGTFVDAGDWAICSASPELFFNLDGKDIVSRPMKGTADRGLTRAGDDRLERALYFSAKDRAENVMIVDMVRNDLGRVALTGSVRVNELFGIEKHPTVWQMTSTVSAKTEAGLPEILKAAFPPASVTGAPKPKTMQIIAELESSPRRVYTGCIGFLGPGRRAQFNVAIRTVVIDLKSGEAEFGVGGGIVRDSTSKKEYEECRIKASLLTANRVPFELLETILWEPENGFFLLEHHLKRLADSAHYFSFPLDLESLRNRLREAEKAYGSSPQKVRITVSAEGSLSHEAGAWPGESAASSGRICLSRFPVSSSDVFLYHKTTNRRIYENALREHPGCGDVILWNEKGELTESTIANLVLETDEGLLTPPVRCGLLAGTFRAWLLENGRIKESVLTADDLKRSRRAYLVNSLRKQWEITVDAEERRFPDGSSR